MKAPAALDYALVDDYLEDGFGLDLLPLLDLLAPPPATVLFSALVSERRALAALREGRALVPKPASTTEVDELLVTLENLRCRRVTGPSPPSSAQAIDNVSFVLVHGGLRTPSAFLPLRDPSLALLRFLAARSPSFTSARDVAEALLRRRDHAAAGCVRRQVADTRRDLGPYSSLIDTVPKRGYRLDARVTVSER